MKARIRIPFAVLCLSLLALVAVPALAASPPTVVKTYASTVSTTEATLNAEVDFGVASTGCKFEYGLDETYGSEVSCASGIEQADRVTISATEGQFRLRYGGEATPDLSFDAEPAGVKTALQALPSLSSATLLQVSGTPGSYLISFHSVLPFQPLGAEDGASPLGGGTGATVTATATVHATLTELAPDTIYHYRLFASNPEGDTHGADSRLHTFALPDESPDTCSNAALRAEQHSAFLPDCRAYEVVSPAEKHGTGVISASRRTRAAADGNAIGFTSLGAFSGALGTGVATDYLSERTAAAGTSGWTTHATTPLQSGTTFDGLVGGLEPLYVGEFSPDLSTGVFSAQSPLTDDPSTANVPNLYLRTDLRTPGSGTYDLLTRCPLCDQTRTPLPPPTGSVNATAQLPVLAWVSPDANHIAFESALTLTAGTPHLHRVEVYEWDRGTVTLAGRVPKSGSVCDDVSGPVCVGASDSIAGQGATGTSPTPHVVSDGSDGHTRLFFTYPTADGVTPSPSSQGGQLYMRVDGSSTIQINVSERSVPDAFAPAKFLDASSNGERVFFMTTSALTEDAPTNGAQHIYMYDATKPPSAPDKLTLINGDSEPADTTFSDGKGIVGLSDDGQYVYFITSSQIVSGGPLLNQAYGLYLWHDGVVRFIASLAGSNYDQLLSSGPSWVFNLRQARVTPDGRSLLYRAPAGVTSQLYLYNVDSNVPPVCVSCDPSGAPDTASARDAVQTDIGGTSPSWHENHALAEDGSRVFFNTEEPLVSDDLNGKADVYEYDVHSGAVHLISSGTSPFDSWFMDASANGDDVFFTTRQQLVGWDSDQEYDLYDARGRGGFPNPPPTTAPCASADGCKGAEPPAPSARGVGSTIAGLGNPQIRHSCPRGRKASKVRGRTRCVKPRKHRHRHRGGSK